MEPNTNKSMNPLIIVGVLVVVVVLGFVMMKNATSKSSATNNNETITQEDQEDDKMTAQTSPAMTADTDKSATVTGSMTDSTVKEFKIEAGSFYYDPKEIKVKKGDKVKIVMTSKDMMHDFNIDEFNVKMPVVKAGNTGTVEFTADKVGSFEYYCSVGQHRANGQVGTLIVE